MSNEERFSNINEENIICEDIILIPINEDHIELIRQWRNAENLKKTFLSNQYITKETQAIWYEKYKNNRQDKMFIISYENEAVGTIALYNIDYNSNCAEFGRLLIGEVEKRGKSIGVKATKTLCNYGFQKLKLDKIIIEVFKDNLYSINSNKKVGFEVKCERNFMGRRLLIMELENK